MTYWLGAPLHGLEGEEFSAFGVSKEDAGVQLVEVTAGSAAERAGLKKNDLIQSLNERKITDTAGLFAALAALGDARLKASVVRNQKSQSVVLSETPFIAVESAADASGFSRLMPPPAPAGVVSANQKTNNEPLASLVDGRLSRTYGPIFSNGVRDGAYKIDLGSSKPLGAVTGWSFNQGGNRGRQVLTIFGSNAPVDPGWNTEDVSRFTPLCTIDTTSLRAADFQAASLRARPGQSLGNFRWIVWRVVPVTGAVENTAFQEFAVELADRPGL